MIVYHQRTWETCVDLANYGGRRGRDRIVVRLRTLPVQSVPITTDVVSSNPDQGEVYNFMW